MRCVPRFRPALVLAASTILGTSIASTVLLNTASGDPSLDLPVVIRHRGETAAIRRRLRVGAPAPDFALQQLGASGRTVRLSDLRGTPVVLIFGSYT